MKNATRVGCSCGETAISRTRPLAAPLSSRTVAPISSDRATMGMGNTRNSELRILNSEFDCPREDLSGGGADGASPLVQASAPRSVRVWPTLATLERPLCREFLFYPE